MPPYRAVDANYEDFLGDWEIAELPHPNMSDAGKMGYYPPAGVILTFSESSDHSSMGAVDYPVKSYKVEADEASPGWNGRIPMENALYLYTQPVVVASNIPTNVPFPGVAHPPQSIMEIIFLTDDHQGRRMMVHGILWDDRDMGKWVCYKSS